MARKFLLIDQSISSIAGHYYEYAMHVLEAAQRAGYEPYLATHRRFAKHSSHSPWKTFPIFRFGYWVNPDPGRGLIGSVLAFVAWLRFRYRLAYNFSLFGLLWAVRHRFSQFLLKQPFQRNQLVFLATLIPAALLLKIVRLIGLILIFPLMVLLFAWRALRKMLISGGFPQAYVASLFSDVQDLLWLKNELFTKRNDYQRWWKEFRALRSFQADMERLLNEVQVEPGDIVFIPTISAIEFMGLTEALKSRKPGGSWHLLFRRDIYPGRASGYGQHEWRVQGLRNSLAVGKTKIAAQDVRFYTDTRELSAQYERLGIYPFHTAPIPHSHKPALDRADRKAIRVIYMGDARGEKGYHYIPGLIEDLWNDYVLTGKVTFHLQSNFNIPGGEPAAAVAREQLEYLAQRAPKGAIELYLKPLTSSEYKELLLSADVNLLLYDRDNYYARSSGILVESLSAGIPVIAPANTWLSRQFDEHIVSWRRTLAEQLPVVRRAQFPQLRWQVHGDARQNPWQGTLLHLRQGHTCFAWTRPAPQSTHLLLRMACDAGHELKLHIDQLDARGTSLGATARLVETTAAGVAELIPLDRAAVQLWIGLTPHSSNFAIAEGDLHYVRVEDQPLPPLSAVGTAYHSLSDIAPCLRDVIDHYDHYRESAKAFAEPWTAFHNAAGLIRALEGRS